MSVRRSVVILGALSAFGPLSMDLYMPALPQLVGELGTTDSFAQATMSACMIGLGVGQLVAGPLSDKVGRRIPLTVGVALFALLSLACAFAPNVEILILLRFLQGLGGAAGMVVARAMVRDMYEGSELARMYSLLMLVGGAAPVLAPLLGGQLVRFMDWRGIFVVLAVIGLVLFLTALFGIRETLPPQLRRSGGLRDIGEGFAAVGRDRLFVGFALTLGCTSAAFFAYLSMSSFVFEGQFGVTAEQFSWIFAGNSIAILVGAQANTALVRRAGTARLLELGIWGSFAGTILLLLSFLLGWGVFTAIAALWIVLFWQGTTGPNSSALALQGHARQAGSASALLGTVQFVVGPIVAPLASLGGATGLTMAVTMATGIAAALIVFRMLIRPILRRLA